MRRPWWAVGQTVGMLHELATGTSGGEPRWFEVVWWWGYLFCAAVMGGIVAFGIRWAAPVHEIGHIVATWLIGYPAHFEAWNQVWMGHRVPFNLAAGYITEMLFMAIIAAKAGPIVRWFVIGSLIQTFEESLHSQDLHTVLVYYTPEVYRVENAFKIVFAISLLYIFVFRKNPS